MRWYLIDRILECEPGKRILGIKSFTRSEQFFEDHFHGMPIVPGVLLIEAMATTGGKAIKLLDDDLLPVLGRVKDAKFYHNVRPGDQCQIYIKIEKLRKSYATALGKVVVEGKTVAEAAIMYGVLSSDLIDRSWDDPIMKEWRDNTDNGSKDDCRQLDELYGSVKFRVSH